LTVAAGFVPLFARADTQSASADGVKLPAGYRDWTLISLARVGGPVNDLRAKLGNTTALKAFRAGNRPFPDGSILVRLAYNAVASEENNAVCRAAAERQGVPSEQIAKLLADSLSLEDAAPSGLSRRAFLAGITWWHVAAPECTPEQVRCAG